MIMICDDGSVPKVLVLGVPEVRLVLLVLLVLEWFGGLVMTDNGVDIWSRDCTPSPEWVCSSFNPHEVNSRHYPACPYRIRVGLPWLAIGLGGSAYVVCLSCPFGANQVRLLCSSGLFGDGPTLIMAVV